MEVTKWLKPSISGSRIGDRASVQAATRVNAEQVSKRSMCRPTRRPFRGRLTRRGEMSEEYAPLLHRGSGGSMYTRKAHATREAPRRDQGWSTGRPRGTGRTPWGGGEAHSVCLTADVSGGLKSHSARGPGLISKDGGNASSAEDDGKVWRGHSNKAALYHEYTRNVKYSDYERAQKFSSLCLITAGTAANLRGTAPSQGVTQ